MEKINHILSRVEDLEGMQRSRRSERIRNTGLAVYPNFPLRADNLYRVGRASGRGRLSLVVKLTMQVSSVGRVVLSIDGERASFSSFSSLGRAEQVMLFSARIARALSGGVIELVAENGFVGHIIGVQVVLFGDEASLVGFNASFATDVSQNILGVLTSKNERLVIERFSTTDLEKLSEVVLGFSTVGDICSDGQGGFYACYIDHSRNLILSRINANGDILSRTISTGKQIPSIAITIAGTLLKVCYIEGGRVFFFESPLSLQNSTSPTALDGERAEVVAFVKNSATPIILLSRDGRIFMRTTEQEELIEVAASLVGRIIARIGS